MFWQIVTLWDIPKMCDLKYLQIVNVHMKIIFVEQFNKTFMIKIYYS